MAENRIVYGVSNLHFGTYTVGTNGTVSLGTPYHLPGTVNISMDPQTEENTFYADNVAYWTGYTDNGYAGDIENANFTDEFKVQFLNYVELDDDGIAQIKGMANKPVYMCFQCEGDQESRRGIFYNVTLGQITRAYQTKEANIEPQTATLPFTVIGDNKTGIIKVFYGKQATAYNTIFTSPPLPALPAGLAQTGGE